MRHCAIFPGPHSPSLPWSTQPLSFGSNLQKTDHSSFPERMLALGLQVFLAHALFLTILLCCYQICTYIVPTLPFWMTDTYRLRGSNRASIVDIFLFLAALAMAYCERKWLFRERTAQRN